MVRAEALRKLFHNGRIVPAAKEFDWTGEIPPPRHVRLLEEPPEGYEPVKRRTYRPRFRTDPRYPYGQPRPEELANGSAPALGTPLPDAALDIMQKRARPVPMMRPHAEEEDEDGQPPVKEKVGAGSALPPATAEEGRRRRNLKID